MKIVVVGMIKNSADVIETFVRANGLWADEFMLIDNISSDNTNEIIAKLIEEGYHIELFKDEEHAYFQSTKMNDLIKKVAMRADVDWIVPLDDDEVLVPQSEEIRVRTVFNELDKRNLYYARWRIYIPTEEDDKDEVCVQRRLGVALADSMVSTTKCFFSRSLALDDSFKIVQGNHDAYANYVKRLQLENIRIAHFPVRSAQQIAAKALVGWTNYLATPNVEAGNGLQWKHIYDFFKNNSDIPIEAMWQMCLMYADPDKTDHIRVEYVPLNLPDEAFSLKYTTANEVNAIRLYMDNVETLAASYAKMLGEKMDTNEKI